MAPENTPEKKVLEVLYDLLREEDILACMVAMKGMEGIVPNMNKFKIKNTGIWEMLQGTMNEFFEVIGAYGEYGLDKVYFELGSYDVIFFVMHNVSLVAITPALANRGLIEVEMENARRDIIKLIG